MDEQFSWRGTTPMYWLSIRDLSVFTCSLLDDTTGLLADGVLHITVVFLDTLFFLVRLLSELPID